jgi:pimeloyl-ACP methyl ester carboxylesterase
MPANHRRSRDYQEGWSEAAVKDRRRAPARGTRAAFCVGAVLAAAALTNLLLARRAERASPPEGKFLTVQGVRLHYVERGSGPVIVLLHGNGAMATDFALSGLIDLLARDHRVVAFDRPGFGFSQRPRGRMWSAQQQASLLQQAFISLGIRKPVLVGHSWGTLVALSLALHEESDAAGLVLLSGYYYPSFRLDVLLAAGPAIPVLGDIMRYTIAPVLGRIMAAAVFRKIFAPSPVSERFANGFPVELAVRPSQIRASAAESALMVPQAASLVGRYAELSLPVAIMGGLGDRIVDFGRQASRLHGEVSSSQLYPVPGTGHMIHHVVPEQVAMVIREVVKGPIGERHDVTIGADGSH